MLDDRTDALFPLPQSAAGKLLAHLVTRQIPGTPIETTPAELAHHAGLRPAEAATALTKLSDDGLVLIEPEADRDAAVITVLLAPPLDEYGIEPRWSESGAPAAAIPATSVAAPDNPGANGTGDPARSRPRGRSMADQAGNEQASAGTPPVAPSEDGGAERAAGAAARRAAGAAGETEASATRRPGSRGGTASATPRGRRTGPVAAAQPLPLVEEDKGKAAATGEERDQGANAVQHAVRGSGRRAAEAASVDETALVRGFVERFERLLAEIDELKRRAQSAEERVATTEKLLRSAERRAEMAETRLAEAQERLRTWAELTRRMQQLSRQADSGSRGRAASSTKTTARGESPPVSS